MNHQKNPIPNGSVSTNNSQGVNKKKRKRNLSQVTDNNMNAITSLQNEKLATTEEYDNSSQFIQSAKRRRKNRKKKKRAECPPDTIKPVLVIKSPDDYSANWKKLKEIISQDEKKPSSSHPVGKHKAKDENFKHRKSKNNHKTNAKDNSSKKIEVEESAKEENEELDIWFDNVDPILLGENALPKPKKGSVMKNSSAEPLVKEESFEGATKIIAMDCEMVGVGMDGKDSIVARVSIVNVYGKVLYDKFVMPTEEVVDYRTDVSGIRPGDIKNGCKFSVVQKEVSDLIEGRILVGHAIHNDLRILFLSHPRSDIRDTSKYKTFVRQFGGRTPSLKKLVERLLGVQIQQGEHNSVQDAQAAMRLYTMHRKEWEKSRNKYRKRVLKNKNLNQGKNKPQSSETAPTSN